MNNLPTEPDPDDWICTDCYKISDPIKTYYGSWAVYIPICIGIWILIIIPSILWLLFLLILVMGGGIMGASTVASAGVEAMNPFPLAQFIPEAPHMVRSCKFCLSVGKMAKIKDRMGQDALYWRRKYHIEDIEKIYATPEADKLKQNVAEIEKPVKTGKDNKSQEF